MAVHDDDEDDKDADADDDVVDHEGGDRDDDDADEAGEGNEDGEDSEEDDAHAAELRRGHPPAAEPPVPAPGPSAYPRPRLHRPAFDRGGNREQRDALAEERFDLLGRIALSLCLIGVLAAVVVRILALLEPRTWSTHDVGNTLLGTELLAVFIGLLAHRRPLGRASVVIGVVLALGAWVLMN